MSEPIPESIPTSSDRRSRRPAKKRALTPVSQQSAQVDALFAHPDREITVPSGGGGGAKARTLAAPPEIVANVQGSSAGAGSGEFHVYKASRRREYERLRLMDEEMVKEVRDKEFAERKDGFKAKEEEKLSKNRAERAKQRARKERARMAKKTAAMEGVEESKKETDGGNAVKKKLAAAKVAALGGNDGDDGEVQLDADANANGQGSEPQGIRFLDDD